MQYSRYLFHNNNLQNDGNLLCTSKCHESVLMVHCHGSCLRHFLSHHTNHLLQTSKSINQSINKSIYQSADICSASSTTFSAKYAHSIAQPRLDATFEQVLQFRCKAVTQSVNCMDYNVISPCMHQNHTAVVC